MHGLIGGRWGSGLNLRGLLVPGRCAGIRHHDGLVGTSTAGAVCRTSGLPHHPESEPNVPQPGSAPYCRRAAVSPALHDAPPLPEQTVTTYATYLPLAK